MEIKGRKVVGSDRGWLDVETGELVLSVRGLSETTYGKVGKKADPKPAKAEPEAEVENTPEQAPEPTVEKAPAKKSEKVPTPKKSAKKAK